MNYLRHEKKEKALILLMRFNNCHLSSVQLLLIAQSNQAMFSLNSSLQLNTDRVKVCKCSVLESQCPLLYY